MSDVQTRGNFAQVSPQIAPISLGQYGLPNILQMLMQPSGQPPGENLSDRTPLDGADLPFQKPGRGRKGGGDTRSIWAQYFNRRGGGNGIGTGGGGGGLGTGNGQNDIFQRML